VSSQPPVAVVIVTWNSAAYLPALAASLARQTHRHLEIVVADNGSADGSGDLALAALGGCTLIRNAENAGFARANNQGIDASKAPYVLLLNHDVELDPRYLEILVGLLESDPTVGWCAGKLLRPSPAGQIPLIDSAGEVLFRNRRIVNRGEGEPDTAQYDGAEWVFGVTAAAAVYRRAMLDELRIAGEVFDSDFFAYIEDSDLNWRAQNRGWKCRYEPAAVAVHARGHATSRDLAIRHHAYANRYLTIAKNDTAANLLRDLPEILGYEAYRLIKTVVSERELWEGYRLAWRLLPRALAKRKDVQRLRQVPARALRPLFRPDDYLGRIWPVRPSGDARTRADALRLPR
jgi:GT2 family glycosyltransferase